MGDVVKLIIPFFSVPKNYDDVLKRLASLAFYEIYVITLIMRDDRNFDTLFRKLESWGPIGKIVVTIPHNNVWNLTGIVIALMIAAFSYIFQFHDRISDAIGIRRRFDRDQILFPLAQRVGVVLNKQRNEKIVENRDRLMRAVFYKYASSSAETPLVDKHDIEQALGAWSWYWAFTEAIFYFLMGAGLAWSFGAYNLFRVFVGISLISLFIACFQFRRLGRYARPQIDRISADQTAAADVRQQFDAL